MSTWCFDLDGTLCVTEGEDYANATPKREAIERVNALYNKGCTIKIWTARGSGSGADYYQLTTDQLAAWGVQYNELSVGIKPVYDFIVDDRAVPIDDWLGDTCL